MPFITVKMIRSEDRDIRVKRKLVEEITKDVVSILKVGPETVTVLIEEVEKENWAEGGKLFAG